jgi:F0F1-type ATP synthase assembly protein I
MRRALVDYTARYHFVTVSSEDRDERFHAFLASHFKINELAAEVRSEVTTLYDYVHGEEERRRREIQKELEIQHKEEERRNQERQDRMNHFLALLTVVFTPLGLWVGIFQDKTLPLELDGQAGRFVPFVGGIVLGVGLYVLARRWMRSPPPDADDPPRGAHP